MDARAWALIYHMAGFSIFPCTPNKKPNFKLLEATGHVTAEGVGSWIPMAQKHPTEEDIETWFRLDPNAGIGMACGEISGVTVIDIDKYVWEFYEDPITKTQKKRKVLGKYTPEEMLASVLKVVKATLISRTGSGGYHIFCQAKSVGNSIKQVNPQIDIKSDRGYIILPPSLHENGNNYAWLEGHEWPQKSLPEFPMFLVQKETSQSEYSEKDEWKQIARGAVMNSRHITLTKVAGFLTNFASRHPEFTYCLLSSYNKAMFSEPKSEKEVMHIFEGILKADYQRNSGKYGIK